MKTRKGIYFDLENSPYNIEAEDYIFYFSSNANKQRFTLKYEEFKKFFLHSFEYHTKFGVNCLIAPAFRLYSEIEKRGFYVIDPMGQIIRDKSRLSFSEVITHD